MRFVMIEQLGNYFRYGCDTKFINANKDFTEKEMIKLR